MEKFTHRELYQIEKLLVKKLEEDKKELEGFLEDGKNKLEDVSWMFDTEELESALDKVRKLK